MSNAVDVFWQFLKLGCYSFGGPIAHLAFFRQAFVEKLGWLEDKEYAQLVAICQFLPGPASSQVGFALGFYRAGWLGALLAFVGFTAPSVILLIAFVSAMPSLPDGVQSGAINALKMTAVIIVFQALWGMWHNICTNVQRRVIALASFVCLVFFATPFSHLLVLLAAAVAGIAVFPKGSQVKVSSHFQISAPIGAICLLLFIGLLSVSLMVGARSVEEPSLLAMFVGFYHAGSLVFGGGHVVLPMLYQTVVATQWVSEHVFIVGYGATQAMPGPLFTFASYLGFEIPSSTSFADRSVSSLVATLGIFLPGFLLLMGVLPFWKRLAAHPVTSNAITGINAGVVGLLAATLLNPIATTGLNTVWDIGFAVVLGAFAVRYALSALYIIALTGVYSFALYALSMV